MWNSIVSVPGHCFFSSTLVKRKLLKYVYFTPGFYQISSDGLTGTDVKASMRTDTDGGLYYTPLTGDMLSTVHDKPQVRLFINNVSTKCSGDCSFQWSSLVTPSITSVSPNRGKWLAFYN